jgi:hypothetical protein
LDNEEEPNDAVRLALSFERICELAFDKDALMTDQAARITEQDTRITEQDGRIGDLEEEVAERGVETSELRKRIHEHEQDWISTQATISEQAVTIRQQNSELASLKEDLEGQEEEIKQLTSRLRTKEREIAAKQSDILAYEGNISKLEEEFAEELSIVNKANKKLEKKVMKLSDMELRLKIHRYIAEEYQKRDNDLIKLEERITRKNAAHLQLLQGVDTHIRHQIKARDDLFYETEKLAKAEESMTPEEYQKASKTLQDEAYKLDEGLGAGWRDVLLPQALEEYPDEDDSDTDIDTPVAERKNETHLPLLPCPPPAAPVETASSALASNEEDSMSESSVDPSSEEEEPEDEEVPPEPQPEQESSKPLPVDEDVPPESQPEQESSKPLPVDEDDDDPYDWECDPEDRPTTLVPQFVEQTYATSDDYKIRGRPRRDSYENSDDEGHRNKPKPEPKPKSEYKDSSNNTKAGPQTSKGMGRNKRVVDPETKDVQFPPIPGTQQMLLHPTYKPVSMKERRKYEELRTRLGLSEEGQQQEQQAPSAKPKEQETDPGVGSSGGAVPPGYRWYQKPDSRTWADEMNDELGPVDATPNSPTHQKKLLETGKGVFKKNKQSLADVQARNRREQNPNPPSSQKPGISTDKGPVALPDSLGNVVTHEEKPISKKKRRAKDRGKSPTVESDSDDASPSQ